MTAPRAATDSPALTRQTAATPTPADTKTGILDAAFRCLASSGYAALKVRGIARGGHLLFAAATSGSILIGIWFEERDLIHLYGGRYRDYRRQVGMLLPLPGRRRDAADELPVGHHHARPVPRKQAS
ncbi:MAG: hypothetical protein ABIX12_05620 [Rubrivivax sp.]